MTINFKPTQIHWFMTYFFYLATERIMDKFLYGPSLVCGSLATVQCSANSSTLQWSALLYNECTAYEQTTALQLTVEKNNAAK